MGIVFHIRPYHYNMRAAAESYSVSYRISDTPSRLTGYVKDGIGIKLFKRMEIIYEAVIRKGGVYQGDIADVLFFTGAENDTHNFLYIFNFVYCGYYDADPRKAVHCFTCRLPY